MKTKLYNIIKKYNKILNDHNKSWESLCKNLSNLNSDRDKNKFIVPTIYQHQEHTSKSHTILINLIKELNEIDIHGTKTKTK